MNGLGINLADYQGGSMDNQALFDNASTTPEQLAELSKAMEAGSTTGRSLADQETAGGALKTESLEKNLKLITFKDSDIRFWKRMPKAAAYNTVEEYNQLKSYGADRGGFNNEGELPEEEDSIYVRRAELVKFLGVTKAVSHPMQLVNTQIGNMIQREVTNGIQWILRKADRGLFWGDDKTTPQEWRGLYAQHAANDEFATLDAYQDSEVVIDLRGKRLGEGEIEDAANAIIRNFGYGNLLVAPPVVLSNFVKSFHASKLIQPNTDALTNGIMGQRVQKFQSQFGEIDLEYDIFAAKAGPRRLVDAATSAKAPAVVVSNAITAAPAGALKSRFAAADAGDYIYAVAAKNRYGEATPVFIDGAAVAVIAGDKVTLDFTDGGGAYAATGYVVYRSKKDAVSTDLLYPIYEVSVAEKAAGYDGGTAGLVVDLNRWLPGTEQAMLLQGDSEVMEFKQLAPLMKMDLAVLSPSKRFMCLLYGTPILYAPKKMIRFINIGTATV